MDLDFGDLMVGWRLFVVI